jgi:hypothetical protein
MTELKRNIAFARVWTVQTEPILPGDLADDLTDRGFVPGTIDVNGEGALMNEVGLADARLIPDHEGLRFVSLSSSKGGGCVVRIKTATEEADPVPPTGRNAVRHPRLVYYVEAASAAHSDRNLCENLAEALLVRTGGLAEVVGRGVKGNKPTMYRNRWLGQIKG